MPTEQPNNETESREPWTWDLGKFAVELAAYSGPHADILPTSIKIFRRSTVMTVIYGKDDYIVANEDGLSCGPFVPSLGRRERVPWKDVTRSMIKEFLETLANEFAEYVNGTSISNLINYNGTEVTVPRVENLKKIAEHLIPERIPYYVQCAADMRADPGHRFCEHDINVSLFHHMKTDLLKYISEL